MLAALYFSWCYIENKRARNLVYAVVAAGMAVWASFTVLNFYLPWLLFMSVFVWQQAAPCKVRLRHAAILAIGALLLAAVCFLPIYRMQADNQLHFWGTSGFYPETVQPLIKCAIMGHPYFDQFTLEIFTVLITAFSVGACVTALWRWKRQNWRLHADLLVFAGFLFAGTVTVNLLLAYLMDVPFLNPRTALFYFPLFALLLIGVAISLWANYGKRAFWFLLPLAAFSLVNFDNNRNLKQSYEWQYDRGSFEVLRFISDSYKMENRTAPFTLDCNWLHQNSLSFHREFDQAPYANHITMPNHYHGNEAPRGNTDFYYTATPEEIQQLEGRYVPVLAVESNRYVLMRRRAAF
jgi:hypothetical protein